MAAYDGPSLEFQSAWVPSLSLGLIKISEWFVYSIQLARNHTLPTERGDLRG